MATPEAMADLGARLQAFEAQMAAQAASHTRGKAQKQTKCLCCSKQPMNSIIEPPNRPSALVARDVHPYILPNERDGATFALGMSPGCFELLVSMAMHIETPRT